MPVGSPITYDRLERAAYHPACAQVALEHAPWLLLLAAGEEPRPGQVIAHPAYGWLVCVRIVARRVVVNRDVAGSAIAVGARRALPEEVELAQSQARAGHGDASADFWLDLGYVGAMLDATADFTGWPIIRLALEPVLRADARRRAVRVRSGSTARGDRTLPRSRCGGTADVPRGIPLVLLLLGSMPER